MDIPDKVIQGLELFNTYDKDREYTMEEHSAMMAMFGFAYKQGDRAYRGEEFIRFQ